jgi:hypothetical protein
MEVSRVLLQLYRNQMLNIDDDYDVDDNDHNKQMVLLEYFQSYSQLNLLNRYNNSRLYNKNPHLYHSMLDIEQLQ